MYRPSNVQCDYPDRVDCGDRPVCDDNDENCEDHHLTTTTPKPSPCDDIECDHGDDFYPEGNKINAINKKSNKIIVDVCYFLQEHANHVFVNVMMEFKMKFVANQD